MWAGSLSEAGFRGSCATSARIFAAEAIRHGRDSSRVITPGNLKDRPSSTPTLLLPYPGRTASKILSRAHRQDRPSAPQHPDTPLRSWLTVKIGTRFLATATLHRRRSYFCRAPPGIGHPLLNIRTAPSPRLFLPGPSRDRPPSSTSGPRRLHSYSCWAASGSATRMRPQYSQTMIFLP